MDVKKIKWDMTSLSANSHIDMDFVTKHSDMNWDKSILICNPAIPLDLFINNDDYKIILNDKNNVHNRYIKYNTITKERIIDINILDIIMKYPIYWHYDIIAMCANFNIDKFFELKIDMVLTEDQLKAFYFGLSRNPNLNIDKHFLPRKSCPHWDYVGLSLNRNLHIDTIINYPNLPWNYMVYSSNVNVNDEIVENNPSFRWNYEYLSTNNNISWDYVKKNLDKEWNFDKVLNKDLLFEEIIEYKDYFEEKIEDINIDNFTRERTQFMASV